MVEDSQLILETQDKPFTDDGSNKPGFVTKMVHWLSVISGVLNKTFENHQNPRVPKSET